MRNFSYRYFGLNLLILVIYLTIALILEWRFPTTKLEAAQIIAVAVALLAVTAQEDVEVQHGH